MTKISPKLSKNACPTIPTELQFLFDTPPIFTYTSRESYNALLRQISDRVNPQDVFEWIWIKDLLDLTLEINDCRRAKSGILEFACGRALASIVESILGERAVGFEGESWKAKWFSGEDGRVEVRAYLEQHGLSMDALVGQAMLDNIDELEKIESMIASAERRRNGILREIEHHWDFSRRLLEAKAEILDGEFTESPVILDRNSAASGDQAVVK